MFRNSSLFTFLLLGAAAASSLSPDPVTFVEVANSSGIDFVHENGASPEKYMFETFGSGVAWLDYDGDGHLDLYFTNGANLYRDQPSPGNVLYRNNGKGLFEDRTASAGVSGSGDFATGAVVGDYNGDGHLDLFVSCYGPNLLYRNNGDGTFSDVTKQARVAGEGQWSSSGGFFDYDRDGDLDLYVVNYLEYGETEHTYCGYRGEGYRMYCHPSIFDGTPDLLYRNNGDGTFSDVSSEAGIANPAGKGLGIALADVDRDGYTDIYIANDAVRNFLYHNQGDGTFSDVAYSAGVGYDPDGKPQAGMGTDAGDIDGDALPDLFVTNFSEELNALYRNAGNLEFEDVSRKVGLGSSFRPLGFGAKIFDFDNDSDLDIYAANGHVIDNIALYNNQLSYAQTDLLYENRDGRLLDVSGQSGPAFQIAHVGRGAAVADYDNDGDQDIAVSNCGGRGMLYRNDGGNRNNWITLNLAGGGKNRFGLGALVQLSAGGKSRFKELTNVGSYLSANDYRLHFGLGKVGRIDQIRITWPEGELQVIENVTANQFLKVSKP